MPPISVSWRDCVDILLLAGILYQSYQLLLIGSRVWSVLRGFFILFTVYVVALGLNLQVTHWLFDRVAPAAFIGLVIIFQPELRAALERMGQGRKQQKMSGNPIQELINAIHELASQKKGALIAIQGRSDLSEYGKAGSVIGSPVSSALLLTIFDSRGPLHDGGVIIRGDTITHAGAIFPLTERIHGNGLSIKHGTRHRAGVGLTEQSDALTIIVSEERGTVSLALDGVLRCDIAPTEVVKALREVYGL